MSQSNKPHKVLLADTMAVNDILKAYPNLLPLICQHIAPTVIIRPVFREVNRDKLLSITEAECEGLGLTILEPEFVDDMNVAAEKRGQLSDTDLYCLHICIRFDYTCFTNDAALIAVCEQRGVRFMRTLRPLVELCRLKVLDGGKAIAIADEMVANGARIAPRHIQNFRKLVARTIPVRGTIKKPG